MSRARRRGARVAGALVVVAAVMAGTAASGAGSADAARGMPTGLTVSLTPGWLPAGEVREAWAEVSWHGELRGYQVTAGASQYLIGVGAEPPSRMPLGSLAGDAGADVSIAGRPGVEPGPAPLRD